MVFVEVVAVVVVEVVVAVVVDEVILDFTLVITIWETILLQHSKTNKLYSSCKDTQINQCTTTARH